MNSFFSFLVKSIFPSVAFLLVSFTMPTADADDSIAPALPPAAAAPIAPASRAKPEIHDGQAFSISIENDSKNVGGPGSDQAYSNGAQFSYVYARDQVPRWAPKSLLESRLFHRGELTGSTANFGISFNHQIYTPNNIHVANLQRTDRPYAAWLSVGFAILLKNSARSQSIELSLGAVGPVALGEQVQNSFHHFIGSEKAEGWGNELNNEPTVQLSYQQRLHFVELRNAYGPYFDLIPFAGGGLGNVLVGAHSGILARLGWNLPNDIGPSRPSGSDSESYVSTSHAPVKSSYYLFAGLRGNAVARNIFLDGNTFQRSHRVTKYPFTFETEVGVATVIHPVSLVWRFVVRSPDFEENSGFNSFASLGISYSTN